MRTWICTGPRCQWLAATFERPEDLSKLVRDINHRSPQIIPSIDYLVT